MEVDLLISKSRKSLKYTNFNSIFWNILDCIFHILKMHLRLLIPYPWTVTTINSISFIIKECVFTFFYLFLFYIFYLLLFFSFLKKNDYWFHIIPNSPELILCTRKSTSTNFIYLISMIFGPNPPMLISIIHHALNFHRPFSKSLQAFGIDRKIHERNIRQRFRIVYVF